MRRPIARKSAQDRLGCCTEECCLSFTRVRRQKAALREVVSGGGFGRLFREVVAREREREVFARGRCEREVLPRERSDLMILNSNVTVSRTSPRPELMLYTKYVCIVLELIRFHEVCTAHFLPFQTLYISLLSMFSLSLFL